MQTVDPAQMAWQLWYEDTFDRETPRQVIASGTGLLNGLLALWRDHLRESVTAQGGRGFSRFNLWLVEERESFGITGKWEGQVHLRKWVYDEGGGDDLLYMLALRHCQFVLRGEDAGKILEQAFVLDKNEFNTWLTR